MFIVILWCVVLVWNQLHIFVFLYCPAATFMVGILDYLMNLGCVLETWINFLSLSSEVLPVVRTKEGTALCHSLSQHCFCLLRNTWIFKGGSLSLVMLFHTDFFSWHLWCSAQGLLERVHRLIYTGIRELFYINSCVWGLLCFCLVVGFLCCFPLRRILIPPHFVFLLFKIFLPKKVDVIEKRKWVCGKLWNKKDAELLLPVNKHQTREENHLKWLGVLIFLILI